VAVPVVVADVPPSLVFGDPASLAALLVLTDAGTATCLLHECVSTSVLDARLDDLLTCATTSLLRCAPPLLSLAASEVREGERWGIAATQSDPVSGADV
jgi:hypothetical protein